MITFDYQSTLTEIDPGAANELRVGMMGALHEGMQSLLERAKEEPNQPQKIIDAYAIVETGETSVQLVNDSGAVFPSYIEGSVPHTPPINDPDLVQWASAHGVTPGQVVGAVRREGTPPHPGVLEVIDAYSSEVVARLSEELDAWTARLGASA